MQRVLGEKLQRVPQGRFRIGSRVGVSKIGKQQRSHHRIGRFLVKDFNSREIALRKCECFERSKSDREQTYHSVVSPRKGLVLDDRNSAGGRGHIERHGVTVGAGHDAAPLLHSCWDQGQNGKKKEMEKENTNGLLLDKI